MSPASGGFRFIWSRFRRWHPPGKMRNVSAATQQLVPTANEWRRKRKKGRAEAEIPAVRCSADTDEPTLSRCGCRSAPRN